MQFSFDWIRQYVALPAGADAATVAARLTAAGLAVEGQAETAGGDVLLDIDVTTNRPDCMNHYGLARELAVLYGVPLAAPGVDVPPADGTASEAAADAVTVAIEGPGCARFAATVVRGVRIGPSPEAIARRLEAVGVRAINNVVDATNYLLWAYGQPLHAYDRDKLRGGRLVARPAHAGETLETLDGEARELAAGELIIADAEGAVGLAGVMGGEDSEVGEATVDVIIEAAHFDPVSVRRSASAHGLKTDASHRFERGADASFCAEAARLAARLIQSLAGGSVLDGVVDVQAEPAAAAPAPVAIEHARLERFGGTKVAPAEVERILEGLGFRLEAAASGAPGWSVTVPGWRRYDFANAYPADVYEEVLRVIGFDAIPATLPAIGPPDAPESAAHRRRRTVQDQLAAAGFAETIAYAFIDRARAEAYPSLLGEAPPLTLANPLSDRYAVMRRSLLPGLVEAARYNLRRGAAAVRLFEVGHVFAPAAARHQLAEPGTPVTEVETVAAVLGGRLGTPWQRCLELDFFDLSGVVEHLAAVCGSAVVTRPAVVPRLVGGASAELVRADDPAQVIGVIGQLDSDEDTVPLFVFELALAALGSSDHPAEVQAPPRLPGIEVATTLTHGDVVDWRAIAAAIEQASVEDLVGFALADRYAGRGVPAGAVNSTIDFTYNAGDRALTQGEVNDRHARLTALLESRFGWTGRPETS